MSAIRRPLASDAADAHGLCIHDLIERQARLTPDQVALDCAGEQLTYRMLDRRADYLARHLFMLGATPAQPVALVAPPALDTIVAMLAILKTGAPCLPIDPAWPRERIAHIAGDARPALWLAARSHLPLLPDGAAPVVCLDRFDWSEAEVVVDIAPRARARTENPAFVIYGSGPTGRPQGIGIAHRNVVPYVRDTVLPPHLAARTRFELLSGLAGEIWRRHHAAG